jgi:hypothetical protein
VKTVKYVVIGIKGFCENNCVKGSLRMGILIVFVFVCFISNM